MGPLSQVDFFQVSDQKAAVREWELGHLPASHEDGQGGPRFELLFELDQETKNGYALGEIWWTWLVGIKGVWNEGQLEGPDCPEQRSMSNATHENDSERSQILTTGGSWMHLHYHKPGHWLYPWK